MLQRIQGQHSTRFPFGNHLSTIVIQLLWEKYFFPSYVFLWTLRGCWNSLWSLHCCNCKTAFLLFVFSWINFRWKTDPLMNLIPTVVFHWSVVLGFGSWLFIYQHLFGIDICEFLIAFIIHKTCCSLSCKASCVWTHGTKL